jgi:hypothetical protein
MMMMYVSHPIKNVVVTTVDFSRTACTVVDKNGQNIL